MILITMILIIPLISIFFICTFFLLLRSSKEWKLYKIKYGTYDVKTTIIIAKNAFQALEKFKKEVRKTSYLTPTIISFEEL